MLLPYDPDMILKQKLQGYELVNYDTNFFLKGQLRGRGDDLLIAATSMFCLIGWTLSIIGSMCHILSRSGPW